MTMASPYHGLRLRCDRVGGLLAVLVWLATVPAAAWAEPAKDTRQAMTDVILRQMDAFRQDDGQAAFAFASPGIRTMFATPERFMRMVRLAYPQIYRSRDVTIREEVDFRGQPALIVHVVGEDDSSVLALYVMTQLEDGSWRIDGCYLLKAPDVGA